MLIRCELHSTLTEWDVSPLNPAPPPSLVCPVCARRRRKDPSAAGTRTPPERIARGGDVEVRVGGTRATTLHEQCVAEALDRARAEGRVPRPLTEQEEYALLEMDAERIVTVERDHTPKGSRRTSGPGRWTQDGWLSYRSGAVS